MASGELNRQISRDLDCEAGVAPLLYGELNRNLQQVAGATGTEIAVRGSIFCRSRSRRLMRAGASLFRSAMSARRASSPDKIIILL